MAMTPEQALAVIEKVAGTKAGYRRAHARGLGVRGTFQATPAAKALSKAEHLQGSHVPVVVRFSNAAGNPCAPDRQSDKEGRVLGMAIRFQLASEARPTWGAINIPAFPARTPEEFIALTAAQAPGPNRKPNMLQVLWHVIRHLHILTSVKAIKALQPAGSFAGETFRGIHTYVFEAADGTRKPFRYEWVPKQQAAALSPEVAGSTPKLYLLDEIRARLAMGTLKWELVAVFPGGGDALEDPSVAWPADRERQVLGTLTLDQVHEDQKEVEGIVFDPTNVVPGIALSDDPILHFRSRAYEASFDRRSRERRAEPAPADMGQ